MKVVVLGAGVVGVSTAWFLREAGCEVTVIDRQPGAALETSFANGGQISVSQSEPWANPAAPMKVLKWLWRDDSPLLFRPHADLRQWAWCMRFLRECLPGRSERNIVQMVNLGLYSRATLQALRTGLGLAYDQTTAGILQLCFDQESLDQAHETVEIMRPFGNLREPVSIDRAIEIEPALVPLRPRLMGATWARDDEAGDARKFTISLAEAAAARGVEFRFNTWICSLQATGGQVSGVNICCPEGRKHVLTADAYVVCLGSYSPLLTAPIGLRLPIYPAKGYSATLSIAGFTGAPHVSITDDAFKLVYSRLGDRIRIAGTAELDGYNTELNQVRCDMLTRRYFELFPDSADANSVQYWTGLRPSTPSNVPLIGRTHLDKLFVNTGHGTLGWTAGPGSGRAIADIITGHQPELDFAFFDR